MREPYSELGQHILMFLQDVEYQTLVRRQNFSPKNLSEIISLKKQKNIDI